MAQFVNYKKRNVALPAGCKDLIDVLEPNIENQRFAADGLARIGQYVSKLLKSRKEFSYLTVSSLDNDSSVRLYRCSDQPLGAIAFVNEDAAREKTIRAFFEHRGIATSFDKRDSDPGSADGAGFLTYPLPSSTSDAIRLTKEVLRSVYSISDTAALDFFYDEN